MSYLEKLLNKFNGKISAEGLRTMVFFPLLTAAFIAWISLKNNYLAGLLFYIGFLFIGIIDYKEYKENPDKNKFWPLFEILLGSYGIIKTIHDLGFF